MRWDQSSHSRSYIMQKNIDYEKDTPFWECLYFIIDAIDKITDKAYTAFSCGVLLYLTAHITLWIWRGLLWQFF